MALLPRPRTPNAQHIGHRRAHSSALEICMPTYDDQELKEDAQPLLEDKVLFVTTTAQQRPSLTIIVVLWVFSTVLACICTYLWTSSRVGKSPYGSFATGFATELRAYHK